MADIKLRKTRMHLYVTHLEEATDVDVFFSWWRSGFVDVKWPFCAIFQCVIKLGGILAEM